MAKRVSGTTKLRRKLKALGKATKARRAKAAALKLPVLDPALVKKLGGKKPASTVQALALEITTFAGVDDAVKRSHRYYHRALAKVFETWLDLQTWEVEHQAALLEALNEVAELKTTRGDGLHILLRSLIAYGSGEPGESASAGERRRLSQLGVQRAWRDASALKFAVRQEVGRDGLIAFIESFSGGVDQMAREEARARKEQDQPVSRAVREKVKLIWPEGLEEAVLGALDDSQGVSIFLSPSRQAGWFEVAVAHNVNRSAENWCDRVKRKHDLEPLDPVSV